MEKTRIQNSLYERLESDPIINQCIDKIEIISLMHKTGHVTLYTRKGKELKIRLADLLKELKIDQTKEVIEKEYTVFQTFLTIKYPGQRFKEFNKIVEQAKLILINTDSDLGYNQVVVRVNNRLIEVNPRVI